METRHAHNTDTWQVQFGSNPSTGTLFRASQFLSEELPIRLAHRVQELDDLPDGVLCSVTDDELPY